MGHYLGRTDFSNFLSLFLFPLFFFLQRFRNLPPLPFLPPPSPPQPGLFMGTPFSLIPAFPPSLSLPPQFCVLTLTIPGHQGFSSCTPFCRPLPYFFWISSFCSFFLVPCPWGQTVACAPTFSLHSPTDPPPSLGPFRTLFLSGSLCHRMGFCYCLVVLELLRIRSFFFCFLDFFHSWTNTTTPQATLG